MYKVFNTELNYIQDANIKESLISILNILPDYFYDIAASSTGKYHPTFSLGKSGLVRHTKVAVRIAIELFNNSSLTSFTQHEKDLIIFSLVIHDGLKCGITKSEYTKFEHPLLISKFIKDNKEKTTLNNEDINFICDCVETHMGPWTKDYQGNEVLNKPENKYQRFVHMCDYLSSRKFLDVKFENNEIID